MSILNAINISCRTLERGTAARNIYFSLSPINLKYSRFVISLGTSSARSGPLWWTDKYGPSGF